MGFHPGTPSVELRTHWWAGRKANQLKASAESDSCSWENPKNHLIHTLLPGLYPCLIPKYNQFQRRIENLSLQHIYVNPHKQIHFFNPPYHHVFV